MTDENDRGLTDPEDSCQNISGWFPDPEDSSKQRFKLYSHGNDIIDYTAKLFQDENLCDCNLVTKGGIIIPVHKFMLIKCSFLWRILLKSSCCYGRCDHGLQPATVFLPDVSFRHLSIVVKFLYSGVFDERVIGQDKEALIAIFKLLGFPLGSVNWCQNIEGYSNCPNCDEYIHKNEMLKHLVKVHVEEPCAKDLAAFEEKKDLATPHCCTECEASKSDKPYYVQYNVDDAREDIVNHYKEEHFEHYCQFVEGKFKENQQDRDKLFERDVVQKVQHVGLQTDFQSWQDWDRMLNTVPQASATGAISPPRTRDDDSEADSCDFSGDMESNMESSDNDEPNQCVKCKTIFGDSSEYLSHTAYKCRTCGAKIHQCQKELHDKKHYSESLPRSKGNKKRKRSGQLSRRLISSSSDEGVSRVKPGQAAKRKRNQLDDSSDENVSKVPPRRPSTSSRPRKPSSSSKVCMNGENSDCDGDNPKDHSGGKKRCRECKEEFSSEHFKRHVVSHVFHWWDNDIPKTALKCPFGNAKGCKQVTFNSWRRVVSHVALHHKQLETKLKLHHKQIKDFEVPLAPPINHVTSNNVKTKKSEVSKPGLVDDEGLLTPEGLLFGDRDRTNRVPSFSSVDNVDDILASSGSNQDDTAADSRKLHLEEMAPPHASSRPSPPNATSRPISQEDNRTKSASHHSNLENSTFTQDKSSSGHLSLNNGSNEGGRAVFEPINTSQIEMDNAEQDVSRDDGNDTDPWEDGFHSDADN